MPNMSGGEGKTTILCSWITLLSIVSNCIPLLLLQLPSICYIVQLIQLTQSSIANPLTLLQLYIIKLLQVFKHAFIPSSTPLPLSSLITPKLQPCTMTEIQPKKK
ncbi:hypothetical protein COCSADRAFT_322086 [Bipolaris sorokiniana ND90Pr]|uniref:Uncharacterized protein n=1 Tax=Cochliobolus sativus (strain ND90Pr / ATCC 201652) TaxID=665912 RepID=M2SA43_COCSN|nr:uncharacterized protein COCSADRAFT_322086 [Bipolaris sorokiniana ND90Pr]EMD64173.1 hypothetical protein COCSADRAFT_322086 [Bipolaris sorokiniana ND90Pr]